MEIVKTEVAAIQKVLIENAEKQLKNLQDFELVMIGGGQGDISLG